MGADMNTERIRERLRLYVEAERAILLGQEYQLGDRRLRRADLSEVRRAIEDLEAQMATAEGRVKRIARVVL